MSKAIIGSLVLAALALAPGASAQERRQPHSGSEAIGFAIGSFIPNDPQFETNNLIVNGLFEHYMTPRVSLRTEIGWTDPGHAREPVDSLRQVPLKLDVNYNWEGGAWHPFVGAGLGAYFLRNKDNGQPFGDTMTEPGATFGGGLEYFVNRTVSLMGEGRYQMIRQPAGWADPSGWSVTGGMKKYF